ncbi:MAG: hypothetical protein Q4A61_03645 [Porphyromonadaceae bacterium]|nr:hypothetical protein [Porphyromonadaceae bacterium]
MASKRKLKKQVVELSSWLFADAMVIRLVSDADKQEAVNELIDDIMVWTDDTIRRIAHPDGKDNPKLVKAYYRELRADIEKKSSKLEAQLTSLVEQL